MSLNKISIYIERNTKIEYRKYTIYKATLYLKTILLKNVFLLLTCEQWFLHAGTYGTFSKPIEDWHNLTGNEGSSLNQSVNCRLEISFFFVQ